MARLTVTVKESLWQEFLRLAKRRRRDPSKWVQALCVDAVQRLADTDLVARTERAFQRTNLREDDVEEMIRQVRRDKARKAADGRPKKASGSGA